ncbi:MAG: diguanylate cyclase, partial [Magnetococcales bacterium]|nr:diguanylate cyclase [Magnetococcales bacterium]
RVGRLLVAENGQKGLEVFRNEKPDVVVTDILMPIMDGLAMAQAIRETEPDLPIIVTTAYNDDDYFLRSIEIGIDRFVLKPTNPFQLLQVVLKYAKSFWRLRERQLADQYVRFVLDIQPNLLMVVAEGEIEYFNRAFLEFFGISHPMDLKRTHTDPGDHLYTPEYTPLSRLWGSDWLKRFLEEPDRFPILYLARPNANEESPRPYSLTTNFLPEQGKTILSFSDITHIEHQMRHLEQKAFSDELTGVYNRARLQGLLTGEMGRSSRHGNPLSVILFDIDHFKTINDTHGHQAGDDVLKKLTKVIEENIRASELLARWGGDEFLVVAPESDLEQARILGEKLRKAVAEATFPHADSVRCSFGVARFVPKESLRGLMERVDRALYQAKEMGRDQVAVALDSPTTTDTTPNEAGDKA